MNYNETLCWIYNNLGFSYIVNAEFRHLTSLYDPNSGSPNEHQR